MTVASVSVSVHSPAKCDKVVSYCLRKLHDQDFRLLVQFAKSPTSKAVSMWGNVDLYWPIPFLAFVFCPSSYLLFYI
jgi:hypothetical protein